MNKTKKIILAASLLLSLLVVVGAVVIAANRKNTAAPAQSAAPTARPEQKSVTRAELAKATGKDGNTCYVAVDGTVYEIKDFSLWQNGEHKPSGGQAYCGADMSDVIDKAPHGRRMLDVLIKVGPLTD